MSLRSRRNQLLGNGQKVAQPFRAADAGLKPCATLVLFAMVAGLGAQTRSSDWTQWRGPNRDGAIVSFTAPATWPDALTRKWKVDVGLGYASPILVGNRVFMFSRRGANEVLAALDAATGKELWTGSYPAPFTVNSAAARHEKGPK